MLAKILNSLAPYDCLGCKTEGALVCQECLPHILESFPSRCFRCQATTADNEVCRACRRIVPIGRVMVGTAYKSYAKQMVQALKFGPDRTTAELIAEWLDGSLSHIDADIVTFIPTASSRARSRGFDQSFMVAREFAKKRGLAFETLLVRYGKSRQVGAERAVRQKQVAGAYRSKRQLNNEKVLLIDDIVTTGATLSEAARTLKQSGASKIDGLVFAQAIN